VSRLLPAKSLTRIYANSLPAVAGDAPVARSGERGAGGPAACVSSAPNSRVGHWGCGRRVLWCLSPPAGAFRPFGRARRRELLAVARSLIVAEGGQRALGSFSQVTDPDRCSPARFSRATEQIGGTAPSARWRSRLAARGPRGAAWRVLSSSRMRARAFSRRRPRFRVAAVSPCLGQ
jgi:hypothetical protein